MGMELRVLGSSSSGNCYILDNGNEALIIEAGIRFIDVKKALDFNIRKVVGCLITHQHNDHAKYAKAMVDCGSSRSDRKQGIERFQGKSH